MSKFFSFKLYKEGLKKSRLAGITIGVLITVICAIVPLMQMLSMMNNNYPPDYTPSTQIITTQFFAAPLCTILFLAPLITLSMFSFLNRRNESDFYHSIPFTRPCVFFSFLAAVLTWLTGTLIASLSLTAILWLCVPYTTFSITVPFLMFGAYFLALLLLTAFTALAMALTGTTISNLLVFLLLFGFVRMAGGIFVLGLEEKFPLLVPALTPGKILLPDFNMPIGLLMSLIDNGQTTVYSNVWLWIYTAAVALLLLAAGCVVYTKRKSQMAGQSAQSRSLQHLYRTAITLPVVFFTALYLIMGDPEIELVLILVVVTLMVYYLYEIITTKQLKNCLSASVFLPVLLICGLLYGGGVTVAATVAENYSPDVDELESVSLYTDNIYYGRRDYEDLMTASVEITDPDALRFVAEKLAEMKTIVKEQGVHNYQYPFRRYEDSTQEEQVRYAEEFTLKITEKSGRVCGRTFLLTQADYSKLMMLFANSKDYETATIAIPSEKEVLSAYITGANAYEEADTLWQSFVSEYNQLSREEKIVYKSNISGDEQLALQVHGTVGNRSFASIYPLDPNLFPETCKLVLQKANLELTGNMTSLRNDLKEPKRSLHLTLYFDCQYYSTTVSNKDAQLILDYLEERAIPADTDDAKLYFGITYDSDVSYYGTGHYFLTEQEIHTVLDMAGILIPDYNTEEPVEKTPILE